MATAAPAQVPDVVPPPPTPSLSDQAPRYGALSAGIAGQFGLLGLSFTRTLLQTNLGLAGSLGVAGIGTWATFVLFDAHNGSALAAFGPGATYVNVGAFAQWPDLRRLWGQVGVGHRRWLDPRQHEFVELGLDLSLPLANVPEASNGIRGYFPLLPHVAVGVTF